MNDLYPLLFEPVYKQYIWGGTRIRGLYGRKDCPDPCAESWELCDRPEGMSVVTNGPLRGTALRRIMEDAPDLLLGSAVARDGRAKSFPLLIKLIDAGRNLSVQVHPDESAARALGAEPKTEMWYVLDAAPGARILAGLKPGTDRKGFEDALRSGALAEVLREVPALPGSAIFVPGGRVHSICEGCLLIEIQQNSHTTYRIYDWGRAGADGKPRPLHVAEALQSIRWEEKEPVSVTPRRLERRGSNSLWEIMRCPYFRVTRLDLAEAESVRGDRPGFRVLFAGAGSVRVESASGAETLSPGTTCLVPASVSEYGLAPVQGPCSVLHIS